MEHALAGIPSLWSFFWVVFVIIPAVRWSVGWSSSRNRWWRVDGWSDDDGRRLSGGSTRRRVEQLQQELESRVGEIDLLNARVAELENRIDFAERLLAGQRDVGPVPSSADRQ